MNLPFLQTRDRQFTKAIEAELGDGLSRAFPALNLLERQHDEVRQNLDTLRADQVRLEDEITDRKEQLRQTVVAIEAEEARERIIEAGKDVADPADPKKPRLMPVDDESQRLVPRNAGGAS